MKIEIELSEKELDMIKNSYKGIFVDVYKMMTEKIINGKQIR